VGLDLAEGIAQQMLDLQVVLQKLVRGTWDRASSNLTAGSLVALRP
jgi:hypothetical protein